MAVKMSVEITNLDKLVKKLGPELIKPEIDDAVKGTADDASPVLKTLVGVSSGRLRESIQSTSISDRGRGKSLGGPNTGLSAAFVSGIWYGRFPDRGTIYIKRRGWSGKARTQVKPQADARLKRAGTAIQKKWAK